MSISSLPIVKMKNQWLFDHVDVKYPTKESLAGKALYEHSNSQSTYEVWQSSDEEIEVIFKPEDVYLVDFHRLTVMFSLLQASQWKDEKQKADVLEFFTQIILSPPCDLYIAFLDGEPAAAAIVTKSEEAILVSDIVCQIVVDSEKTKREFTSQLIDLVSDQKTKNQVVYIELK
ncbi:flavodoxin [Vibrio kyushuensis]|uniref:flavodoxin n=1 Tax=Vibrio kyushuensis TaxID=2910249 RepID=UPI003D107CF7